MHAAMDKALHKSESESKRESPHESIESNQIFLTFPYPHTQKSHAQTNDGISSKNSGEAGIPPLKVLHAVTIYPHTTKKINPRNDTDKIRPPSQVANVSRCPCFIFSAGTDKRCSVYPEIKIIPSRRKKIPQSPKYSSLRGKPRKRKCDRLCIFEGLLCA